ncbi:alpha/beta hydrolase [uncultured Brevundimonas sp.]|uniref:alpha/beta fold hydrolase n=1 Tax=uncultured Brevundimonas sp. TaxID=213418 RepID=UPI00261E2FEB|nr:alpha/beta hydrolase [uncultured Brevundimonas sp.]
MDQIKSFARPDGETIAYKQVEGSGPVVICVGGFRSDMEGTKALALDEAARAEGWNYVRYDHFAHGVSSGDWTKASIGRWREDCIALIDELSRPVILVGSSMGGWVSLLAAVARPQAVVGMVLVNPAQDFTERLMWPDLPDHIRQEILRDGIATISDPGLGSYQLTKHMFDEARDWLLLDDPILIPAPIHILQGKLDESVPWRMQLALLEKHEGGDVRLDIIKDGDHRLSKPHELERLVQAVSEMRKTAGA